jgi:hypothetical protein
MTYAKLKTLAGAGTTDIIVLRIWHITIFTFLFSFLTLYAFFEIFQPTTLFNQPDYFVVPHNNSGAGPYSLGASDSSLSLPNKFFSDKGRLILFAWSFGLGALIGLIVHFLLVFYY